MRPVGLGAGTVPRGIADPSADRLFLSLNDGNLHGDVAGRTGFFRPGDRDSGKQTRFRKFLPGRLDLRIGKRLALRPFDAAPDKGGIDGIVALDSGFAKCDRGTGIDGQIDENGGLVVIDDDPLFHDLGIGIGLVFERAYELRLCIGDRLRLAGHGLLDAEIFKRYVHRDGGAGTGCIVYFHGADAI